MGETPAIDIATELAEGFALQGVLMAQHSRRRS